MIRHGPHYRREAFVNGLARAGYQLVDGGKPDGPQDLLIIWNRYGGYAQTADQWERCGGTVIVCENGYAGKDSDGRQYYAMSAHGHNGSGWFPIGSDDRFSWLGLAVEPWRDNDGHTLIRGQRGIGTPLMASPPNWHVKVGKEIGGNVLVRDHPGRHEEARPIEHDLRGAKACVIWASSVGVKALLMGIPVFYAAPYWICSDAAAKLENFPNARRDNRKEAFHCMAWGQRSVAEIESGEPFVTFREAVRVAA